MGQPASAQTVRQFCFLKRTAKSLLSLKLYFLHQLTFTTPIIKHTAHLGLLLSAKAYSGANTFTFTASNNRTTM